MWWSLELGSALCKLQLASITIFKITRINVCGGASGTSHEIPWKIKKISISQPTVPT